MRKHLKSVLALTVICSVIALLMAATNMLTSPIIEENEQAAANDSLLVVLPDGKDFEKMDLSAYTLPSTVTGAYKEANGGYVIELLTAGYGANFKLMCGIDATGTVKGSVCISSSETLGYEKTYGENLLEATVDTVDSVDTVAGATKTTEAYKNAVKDALNAVIILQGGSVDIRDEAAILADNLAAALPSANGAFTEVFIVEDIVGVDAIYEADNGVGFVYVVGETFVGLAADGTLQGTSDEATAALVADAFALMAESRVTLMNIEGLDLPTNVLTVSKTDSGNYVFELRAAGFGINGDEWYNPSGEYIYISLAATKEGKIISVKTTAQAESDGIGSACEDKDFYSQFVGKTEADYKDIDAISGATITTNGYKTAVGRALEAIKILEGAN